ncbi:hypothetical protein KKC62_02100 [Patescibacteria group bacterium]|nr:hypothetical protein [Patescibacteria group bacterium]MBU1952971.1 hypothetical protein [Patescibacteria group bacterium]
MITEVEFDKLKVGYGVLVMSRKLKFLAHGVVTRIDDSQKCAVVEITSFDSKGIDVKSCIGSENAPGNVNLTIGKSTWFPSTEIFWIVDNDK